MTTTLPSQAMTAFDALARGASAPAWVTGGIRSRWLPAEPIHVTLIAVSENATFRVSVDGIPRLVVRVQRPGYVGSLASAESELQWVEAIVRDTDIRTPRPVRGVDGGLVQSFSGPADTTWTAVAFAHVGGAVLEDLPDASAHFAEIGRLTAVLHEHSRAWRAPNGFERFSWDLPDLVGPAARWGDWAAAVDDPAASRLLRRAQDRAIDVIERAGRTPHAWGLIHSDLRPSNIMIDGEALTIIDFDDCGHSWRLYDFGAALTFYEHRPEAIAMAGEWLDGYRSVLPLSIEDLETAAALSAIRRLTMLGWSATHRADALPADLWDELLPGTVLVAERYLARTRWMVDPV